MKLTHHGHSCVEIERQGSRVLIDPGTFSSFGDVRGVDAVVVTHGHPDHLDPEAVDGLLERHPSAAWFADPQTAERLRARGIDVTTTEDGRTFTVGSMTCTGVGATHAEIHPYIDRVTNVGVLVTADGGPTLFHPGDSLASTPSGVDHLLLPLVAPWSAVRETIAFVRAVKPRHVIPIHDQVAAEKARGIYLGHVRDHGLDGGVDVIDLGVGESTVLT